MAPSRAAPPMNNSCPAVATTATASDGSGTGRTSPAITTAGDGRSISIPNPSPRIAEAFFSSAAPTSYGSRTARKSNHLRVVARIRPLSEAEVGRGCECAIFPLNSDGAEQRSPRLDEDGGSVAMETVGSSGSSLAEMAARFDTAVPRNRTRPSSLPDSVMCSPGTPSSEAADRNALDTSKCRNTSHSSFDISCERSGASPLRPREGYYQPPSPSPHTRNSRSSPKTAPELQSLAAGKTHNARKFEYDAVFDPCASQHEVYARSVGDAVRRNIFRGYNTTILAYGQTGSGKTYTMNGPIDPNAVVATDPVALPCGKKRKILQSFGSPKRQSFGSPKVNRKSLGSPRGRLLSPKKLKSKPLDDEVTGENKNENIDATCSSEKNDEKPFVLSEDDGIIPRAVYDLFRAKERHATAGDVKISITYLEIHNDEIRDLLSDGEDSENLQLRDHGDSGGVTIKGLTSISVISPRHVKSLMDSAARRRTTGSTRMNARSSRSHAICILHVTVSPAVDRAVTSEKPSDFTSTGAISAKLTLVDLAGSERLKRTGSEGLTQQEGININKDLFVLGKVVSALADRSKSRGSGMRSPRSSHIPYRDCKLTRILRDSLGGNCCTVMVACISPADCDLEESVNTLRYADRARAITNSIKQNLLKAAMTPAESAVVRRENIILKNQIEELTGRVHALEQELTQQRAPPRSSADGSDTDDDPARRREAELTGLREEVSTLRTRVASLEADGKGDDFADEPMDEAQRPEIDGLDERGAVEKCGGNEVEVESVAPGLSQEDYFSLQNSCSGAGDISASKCDRSLASGNKSRLSLPESACSALRRRHDVEDEISKREALRDRLDDEIFALQERVESLQSLHDSLKAELEKNLKTELDYKIAENEARARREHLGEKVSQLELSQKQLREENSELREHNNSLVAEHSALMEEVEKCKEMSAMAAHMKEAKDTRSKSDEEQSKLKAKVEALASERDELRVKLIVEQSMRKEKDEEVARLKENVRSLKSEMELLRSRVDGKENECAPPTPRACGAVGKMRSGTASGILSERNSNPASASEKDHEDVKSVLFGRESKSDTLDQSIDSNGDADSVKSDQRAIRQHAEKLLYWANKAIERRNSFCSPVSSEASSMASFQASRQDSLPTTRAPSGSLQNAKPVGHSLPPRRNMLPPQPPKAPEEGSASSNDRTVTKVETSLASTEATTVMDGRANKKEVIDMHFTKHEVAGAGQVLDDASCTCSSSLFSGNEAQIELLLPKLGMACTCGKRKQAKEGNATKGDPASLKNILRPWQVHFLESVGVTTAEQLVLVQKKDARRLAGQMKTWRERERMKPARTRSCYIALHIWARTAKIILKSVTKQQKIDCDVSTAPNFLEVSFRSANNKGSGSCSVSTLGCGSVQEGLEETMEI